MITIPLEEYLSLLFAKQSVMCNYVAVDWSTLNTIAQDPEYKLWVKSEASESDPEINKLYRLNVWEEEYKLREAKKLVEDSERKVLCRRNELVQTAVQKLANMMGVDLAIARVFLDLNLKDTSTNKAFLTKLGLEEIL